MGVDDGEEQGIYRPAILILTDPTTDMWDGEEYLGEWFKGAADDAGGKPIGPGGTEAFAMAGAALREVEGMLHPGDLIVVGAATERLFRIYDKYLTRQGYTRVAGELTKVVG